MTRVDCVTTVNDPDDIGERVVRDTEVRCPECGRMYWLIRWDDYGWPECHCDVCDRRESWPFETPGIKDKYDP